MVENESGGARVGNERIYYHFLWCGIATEFIFPVDTRAVWELPTRPSRGKFRVDFFLLLRRCLSHHKNNKVLLRHEFWSSAPHSLPAPFFTVILSYTFLFHKQIVINSSASDTVETWSQMYYLQPAVSFFKHEVVHIH